MGITALLTFKAHEADVTSVCFSPDGKRLASGSLDGSIRLTDVITGQEISRIRPQPAFPILAVAFSPDGKLLASGGFDKKIRVWDVETGAQKVEFTGHTEDVNTLQFVPLVFQNGDLIASGSSDRTVRLWKVATGEPIGVFTEHTGAVTSLAFLPAPPAPSLPYSPLLYSAGRDATVRVRDIATQIQIQQFGSGNVPINSVTLSWFKLMFTSGEDSHLRLRQTDTTQSSESDTTAKVIASRLASSGWWGVTIDAPGSVSLWMTETRVLGGLRSPKKIASSPSVSASPTSIDLYSQDLLHFADELSPGVADTSRSLVVSGGADGTITLWDVTGDQQAIIRPHHQGGLRGAETNGLAISADGRRFSCNTRNTVEVWNLNPMSRLRGMLKGLRQIDIFGGIVLTALSEDGSRLLIAEGASLEYWDLASFESPLFRISAYSEGTIGGVAILPGGKHAITIGGTASRIWNLADGSLVRELAGHLNSPSQIVISSDGNSAFIIHHTTSPQIGMWNLGTGSLVQEFNSHSASFINGVVITDGGTTVTAAVETVGLVTWSISTGLIVRSLPIKSTCLAISPDGKKLLTSLSGVLDVRDTLTGSLLQSYFGHRKSIEMAIFSPDGKTAISCSRDQTIRTWEIES